MRVHDQTIVYSFYKFLVASLYMIDVAQQNVKESSRNFNVLK